nr:type II toxin-antitoxin system antitoxin SocA domain-containing protein [uncultured Blautia sp.]
MENSLAVAKTLYGMYAERFHENMDEMKMHKLMYFAQRESLMYHRTALFNEDFYGWKYGPVLKSVRHEYVTGSLFSNVEDSVSSATEKMLKSVLERYGTVSSWKLSSLSHDEFSWKKARKGLGASENGDVKMSLNAMKVDATHELAVRKMHGVR